MKMKAAVASFVALRVVVGCTSVGTGGGPIAVTFDGLWAAAELGVITDERLQVIEVLPDSAAAQAGIQQGDILVSVAPVAPEGVAVAEMPFTEREPARNLIGAALSKEEKRRRVQIMQELQNEREKEVGLLTSTPIPPSLLDDATPTPEPTPTAIATPEEPLTPLPTPVKVMVPLETSMPLTLSLLIPTPPPIVVYDSIRVKVNRGGEVIEIVTKPFPYTLGYLDRLPNRPTPLPSGYSKF
jgi:hypothetical protein